MFDRQTDTLWTQVDGRSVKGRLFGRRLDIVPSVHATWKEWVTLYPDSHVLKKRGEFRSSYDRYNRSASQLGIMGRRNPDSRLPGKERILGIRAGDTAMAFPVKAVRKARLVHAQVGPLPLLLIAPDPKLPVLAYERRTRGKELTFRIELEEGRSVLRDPQTGSTWEIATGKATAGPLAGAQLPRATAFPAFWFGWRGYFPNSEIWSTASDDARH